jgi:hypothetical protein
VANAEHRAIILARPPIVAVFFKLFIKRCAFPVPNPAAFSVRTVADGLL